MTSALILIGYAAAVGVIGSRLLAAVDWVRRWPRAAVVTWQLLTVFVVGTVLVAIASLSFGLVQLCKQVAALVPLCVDAMAGVTVTPPSTAAVVVAVGLLGAVLARLGWSLGRTVLDTSKYESAFATATTPLATAISDTIAWYQTRASTG